jgi:hypothetical protein
MLKEVQAGDVVVVVRGFVSLREKHIDTTSAGGRLVSLSLNANWSRAEWPRGARAVNNGVKFGRPHKLDAFQKREALARIEAGESSP